MINTCQNKAKIAFLLAEVPLAKTYLNHIKTTRSGFQAADDYFQKLQGLEATMPQTKISPTYTRIGELELVLSEHPSVLAAAHKFIKEGPLTHDEDSPGHFYWEAVRRPFERDGVSVHTLPLSTALNLMYLAEQTVEYSLGTGIKKGREFWKEFPIDVS